MDHAIMPEKMWAIYHPSCGFYYGTWSSRAEAQQAAPDLCQCGHEYRRHDSEAAHCDTCSCDGFTSQ